MTQPPMSVDQQSITIPAAPIPKTINKAKPGTPTPPHHTHFKKMIMYMYVLVSGPGQHVQTIRWRGSNLRQRCAQELFKTNDEV